MINRVIKNEIDSELSWGGAIKFFQLFQITYLDLENSTQTVVSNKDKIGQLNAALHDDFLKNVRTTCETFALKTENSLDYPRYLQSMITHSDNLRTSSRKNSSTETYGGGRGSIDKGDMMIQSGKRT